MLYNVDMISQSEHLNRTTAQVLNVPLSVKKYDGQIDETEDPKTIQEIIAQRGGDPERTDEVEPVSDDCRCAGKNGAAIARRGDR
jgi:hypothetical protein